MLQAPAASKPGVKKATKDYQIVNENIDLDADPSVSLHGMSWRSVSLLVISHASAFYKSCVYLL